MVLINGVKYACERCIRGHRVTTCTHTDQPLMMIKPKGRPSTQCPFCKQQRKIRNAHVNCNCPKKLNERGQTVHDSNCPCHISGECTCCSKNKKLNKKKDKDGTGNGNEKGKDKDKEKDRDKDMKTKVKKKKDEARPNEKACHDVNLSTPETNQELRSPSGNLQSYNLNSLNFGDLNLDLTHELMSSNAMNPHMQSVNLANTSSQPLVNASINSNPMQSGTNSFIDDLRFNRGDDVDADKDKESLSNILQSWDMSSPPIGNSDSIASMLSDANNSSQSLNTSASNPNNRYNRQIGLNPLQNFRSSSKQQYHQQMQQHQQKQQQRGLGEISIPVDEYMQPLNNMNVHFNNFLNNLSDPSPPIESSIISPNSISPSIELNNFGQIAADSHASDDQDFSNKNSLRTDDKLPNLHANSYRFEDFNINEGGPTDNDDNNDKNMAHDTKSQHSVNDVLLPTPGNGLLDIFEYNTPTHKIYQNTSSTGSNNNHNEPDSLFPLFPLIGPSYTSNSNHDVNDMTGRQRLSQSNLNSLNMKPSNSHSDLLHQATLKQAVNQHVISVPLNRNVTGSSTHSSNHSVYSNNSHNIHNSHHHGHGHHHHYNKNSQFQPYPTLPRRSSSFLSIASSNSVLSNSPSGYAGEQPQQLTMDPEDSIEQYNGPQLTNSKTNTTLMDDIYQTKTYTDSQSISSAKNKRKSLQNMQQMENWNDALNNNDDSNIPVTNENANPDINNIDSLFTFNNIGAFAENDLTTGETAAHTPSQAQSQNPTNNDVFDQIYQYDDQLLNSLSNNNL